tara:strand:+ start:153 stop:485 length:333 start_codon:yes stop_codon:yes gene_type:complete
VGNIAIASTIIPIPPNHCKRDLQIKIPSERFSKLEITVDPVVVIPLTDSKKASVYDKDEDEYTKGIAPKREITIQEDIVRKKACLIPILTFFFLKDINSIIPIKKVVMLE